MKVVAKNRRARYDYEITDTVEAGIMLTGQEVKSCRANHVHLAGAYVSFLGGKATLKSMKISPYSYASGLEDYDPGQDRKLLLKKKDIQRLQSALNEKGITLIPLEVHAGKYIKVILGLGKGKKRHDKRQSIKERDQERRIKRGDDI
ncbi:SsrA-binding protein SmpB [Patescibacteria group bacterium]|nr:SsrA-binding protein SmpB [Patescibacteria group bacterium]